LVVPGNAILLCQDATILFHSAPFQRLGGNHQNSVHIGGGDGGVGSNRPETVVAKGGKEVLSHRTVVSKPLRVMAAEVPAGEGERSNLAETLLSVDRLEILFLMHVRAGGETDLSFDDRDLGIAQADFVAGIDDGVGANGRGVGKVVPRHVSPGSKRGVLA